MRLVQKLVAKRGIDAKGKEDKKKTGDKNGLRKFFSLSLFLP